MGKHWFTDGVTQVLTEECPDGFHSGRLPVSEDTRRKMSENNGWRSMSKDVIESRNKKISETINNRTPDRKKEISLNISAATVGKHKGHIPWNKGTVGAQTAWNKGIPMTEEAKNHLREIYNSLPQEVKDKRANAVSEKLSGRSPWNRGKTYSLDPDIVKKSKIKENYTKKLNGSYLKSSAEECVFSRLSFLFEPDDIVRQYFDADRYPYSCDFYIKSLDMFIEVNFNWTHGGCPFIANDVYCESKLESWKLKSENSDYYKNAIYTWTDLDVRKQKCATENNLNYISLYNKDDIDTFFDVINCVLCECTKGD